MANLSFKFKGGKGDLKQLIQQQYEKIQRLALDRLKFIGEAHIRNARMKTAEQGGFDDQTGNLRSSIGYIILSNAEIVLQTFPGGKGAEGKARGEQVAQQVAKNYPLGLILICVAGMDYAVYVEANGRDVITGSSQIAATQLKEQLKQLQDKL